MLDIIKFQIEVGSILKRLPAANAITGTMIILIGMIPTAPQTSFSVDRVANFLYNTYEIFLLPDILIFNKFFYNESLTLI